MNDEWRSLDVGRVWVTAAECSKDVPRATHDDEVRKLNEVINELARALTEQRGKRRSQKFIADAYRTAEHATAKKLAEVTKEREGTVHAAESWKRLAEAERDEKVKLANQLGEAEERAEASKRYSDELLAEKLALQSLAEGAVREKRTELERRLVAAFECVRGMTRAGVVRIEVDGQEFKLQRAGKARKGKVRR